MPGAPAGQRGAGGSAAGGGVPAVPVRGAGLLRRGGTAGGGAAAGAPAPAPACVAARRARTRVRALLLRWRCCACVACMHGAACRNLDAEVESDHAGLLSAVVSRGAAHKSPDCRVWGGHCPGKKKPHRMQPRERSSASGEASQQRGRCAGFQLADVQPGAGGGRHAERQAAFHHRQAPGPERAGGGGRHCGAPAAARRPGRPRAALPPSPHVPRLRPPAAGATTRLARRPAAAAAHSPTLPRARVAGTYPSCKPPCIVQRCLHGTRSRCPERVGAYVPPPLLAQNLLSLRLARLRMSAEASTRTGTPEAAHWAA